MESGPQGPVVSGVSPNEGQPGTRLTIRGENLGDSLRDIMGVSPRTWRSFRVLSRFSLGTMYNSILVSLPTTDIKIGGHSCKESLEYFSSKKLFCLTPNVEGPSQIIITTLSGGSGTCTVTYYGHAREATPKLGGDNLLPVTHTCGVSLPFSLPLSLYLSLPDPMEESPVWQEEDVDLLVSYSTKPPAPVYTHRKRDPMGPPSSASAGGKKKLSRENLGAMFPHGKEQWRYSEIHRHVSKLHVFYSV